MIGSTRACSSCGGLLLGRRTRFCASCAPPRRSVSDPRYGSPQWKRTVLAVKRRDGWRCQHCGTTERLVVDHRTPHDRFAGSFFDHDRILVGAVLGRQQQQTGSDGRGMEGRARSTSANPDAKPDGPQIRGIYSIGGRQR